MAVPPRHGRRRLGPIEAKWASLYACLSACLVGRALRETTGKRSADDGWHDRHIGRRRHGSALFDDAPYEARHRGALLQPAFAAAAAWKFHDPIARCDQRASASLDHR